jgi:hypothetical protein
MDANDPAVKRFNQHLDSLSSEEIEKMMNNDNQQTQKLFSKIKEGLSNGQCGICGHPLTHFAITSPCHHWLLNPIGIKKKLFRHLFERWGYHQLETYLRWIANTKIMGVNINDLECEKSPSKVIEQTIRYEEIEWSFSCGKNDMEGHAHKHEGKKPHYHFEMRYKGNVIIRFNDYHINFLPYDFYCFAVKKRLFPKLGYQHVNAASIQTLLDRLEPEILLDHLCSSNGDDKKAAFKLDTFIEADEGSEIPMDVIAELMEEGRRTGVSFAKLMREKKIKNVSVKTIISPGPAIPEMSKRTPR